MSRKKRLWVAVSLVGLSLLGVLIAIFWESLVFRFGDKIAVPMAKRSFERSCRAFPDIQLKPSSVEVVTEFQALLADQGVDLKILHYPLVSAIVAQMDEEFRGPPATEPCAGLARSRLFDTQLGLADEDRFHGYFPMKAFQTLHGKRLPIYQDAHHSDWVVSNSIMESALPALGLEGRVLVVGDSHAGIMYSALKRVGLGSASCLAFPGRGDRLAFELSSLGEEYLSQFDMVLWVLWDRYLDPSFADGAPFPPVRDEGHSRLSGGRIRADRILQTPIPSDIEKGPYKSALIAHVYRTAEGESLVGIHQLMRDRVVRNLMRTAKPTDSYYLNLVAWENVAIRPEIGTAQLIDTTEDYTSPRFWVEDFLVFRASEEEAGKPVPQDTVVRN